MTLSSAQFVLRVINDSKNMERRMPPLFDLILASSRQRQRARGEAYWAYRNHGASAADAIRARGRKHRITRWLHRVHRLAIWYLRDGRVPPADWWRQL